MLALSACQPLDGLLKLKPDLLPRAPASAAAAVQLDATASTPATPGPTATPTPTPVPTATATPFLSFGEAPQGATPPPATNADVATPTPTPTPRPTATPTPSQPATCTRTRQVTSTGGPQHGRFNGAILPREWASVYANEDEILHGIDNVYQTDWACFQAFYPDATKVYKQLRGRS